MSIRTGIRTRPFRGGVHPEDGKALSNAAPIQIAPLLQKYFVPLQQNIGKVPNAVAEALIKEYEAKRRAEQK